MKLIGNYHNEVSPPEHISGHLKAILVSDLKKIAFEPRFRAGNTIIGNSAIAEFANYSYDLPYTFLIVCLDLFIISFLRLRYDCRSFFPKK